LLEEILFYELTFGDMMQKTFVRTGSGWQITARFLIEIGREFISPP